MESRVILTPTKEVQARIDAEAKKAKLAAKRAEAANLRKEVYNTINEGLRGLNASAKYLSSEEGINTIKKVVPSFKGKVSKGQLLTAFTELDQQKTNKAIEAGKEPKNLILVLNNGERRNQFSNAQLIKAAEYLTK
jgi:hypothetical protein